MINSVVCNDHAASDHTRHQDLVTLPVYLLLTIKETETDVSLSRQKMCFQRFQSGESKVGRRIAAVAAGMDTMRQQPSHNQSVFRRVAMRTDERLQ